MKRLLPKAYTVMNEYGRWIEVIGRRLRGHADPCEHITYTIKSKSSHTENTITLMEARVLHMLLGELLEGTE